MAVANIPNSQFTDTLQALYSTFYVYCGIQHHTREINSGNEFQQGCSPNIRIPSTPFDFRLRE